MSSLDNIFMKIRANTIANLRGTTSNSNSSLSYNYEQSTPVYYNASLYNNNHHDNVCYVYANNIPSWAYTNRNNN